MIKLITGNLDNQDGERLDKIMQSLLNNQNGLQAQLDLQYTINHNAIQKYEETIKNIEHNENLLKSKLLKLSFIVEKVNDIPNTLYVKELCNQFIILYNTILNVFQEIENSLTFCRLKTFHPSIIRPRELISELEKLKKTFKNQLTFKADSLTDLQKVIEVDCRVDKNDVVYFLSYPLNFEEKFDMYYLLPIPSFENNSYKTILTSTKYFLKSQTSLKPLKTPCTYTSSYQCSFKNLKNKNLDSCEQGILQEENTDNCKYLSLDVKENYIELIPEINQYLVVFPFTESIRFETDNEVEIKEFQGIYLIEKPEGKIIFRNEILAFHSITGGKPIILPDLNLKPKVDVFKGLELKVKDLEFNNINLNQLTPREHIDSTDPSKFLWYLLSSCTFLISSFTLILVIFKKYVKQLFSTIFKSKVHFEPVNTTDNLYPNLGSNLPGQARF